MLLALDVGNTNITMGVYDDKNLIFVSRMATDTVRMEDQYAVEISDILKLYNIDKRAVKGAVISSVVPRLTGYISKAIKLIFSIEALVVSADIVKDLEVKGGSLNMLGADLIVGCLAAKRFYSYPNIVIDMGTATTLFVTDKDGFIIGGSILPGVGISLDALTGRAAQLSSVSLETPKSVIGTTTPACIQSGIIFGASSMIDGLCERIETELGYECTKIATGGLAKTVVENCKSEIILSDTLLLDGLKIIYEEYLFS